MNNIYEGNKLIAEFMGGKVEICWTVGDVHSYAWVGDVAHSWRKEVMKMRIGEAILLEMLAFHLSWDWLMPACKKFDTLPIAKSPGSIRAQYEQLCDDIDNDVTRYNITPAWESLVTGIKWFNNNKQTT